jgi:hypothetical protein
VVTPVRRWFHLALAVAWSVYAVTVVLAWRKASAAPPDSDSQVLVAAAWGLMALLLATSWSYQRGSG